MFNIRKCLTFQLKFCTRKLISPFKRIHTLGVQNMLAIIKQKSAIFGRQKEKKLPYLIMISEGSYYAIFCLNFFFYSRCNVKIFECLRNSAYIRIEELIGLWVFFMEQSGKGSVIFFILANFILTKFILTFIICTYILYTDILYTYILYTLYSLYAIL